MIWTCSGAHIDGVQKQFPTAVSRFNEAAETFHGLLTTVRDELDESGQAIVRAATTYHGPTNTKPPRSAISKTTSPPPEASRALTITRRPSG
ncbi:hypothetical protein DFR76_102490 [Nocardia pseudobrasiliensis]|uniref:Uncharacterized protein n=1 Tax=Nocardia pseudobrasiliensis TaxID=45979 RepID=A0A370IBI7_9NOCA|nr:hypothetical protein DFR76_102490 [Nocardia pseudobrasiliensis]